ncbi:hypothetical protein N9219_01150 [bacterium]|nr:hypothetical protein [bacterium]
MREEKEDVAAHLSLQIGNYLFIPLGRFVFVAYESTCLKTGTRQFEGAIIQIDIVPSYMPHVIVY